MACVNTTESRHRASRLGLVAFGSRRAQVVGAQAVDGDEDHTFGPGRNRGPAAAGSTRQDHGRAKRGIGVSKASLDATRGRLLVLRPTAARYALLTWTARVAQG